MPFFGLSQEGQVVTNAEARFSNSFRTRNPEGSLGRTAQDVHLTLTQLLNYEKKGSNERLFILTRTHSTQTFGEIPKSSHSVSDFCTCP